MSADALPGDVGHYLHRNNLCHYGGRFSEYSKGSKFGLFRRLYRRQRCSEAF